MLLESILLPQDCSEEKFELTCEAIAGVPAENVFGTLHVVADADCAIANAPTVNADASPNL